MKSTIRMKTYKAIYRLLDKVSPLSGDCGLLCGAVCCNFGGQTERAPFPAVELGIYLLPGEDKLFAREEDRSRWETVNARDYDFPDSWKGKVYFIRCAGASSCRRDQRPIQCRTFPLAPHITEDGVFLLIPYTDPLPYKCPLIEENTPLDAKFVKATYTAWTRLLKDPLILDLVEMDSRHRD